MTPVTNIAQSVDQTFLFITVISVALLGLVTFFMIYFAVRYSRSRSPEATEVEGSLPLEIAWTVIPTILVLFMFYFGYKGFVLMRSVPEGAMNVTVTGRMWSWSFEYENGKKSEELVVPIGKPVALKLISVDVIHSLFIPAFRVKEDAMPGQINYLWFIPEVAGEYDVFCTEYCGVGHSKMLAKARVLSEDDFNKWYSDSGASGSKGLDLMKQTGCLGCHSLDGTRIVGPTFKGLWGSEREVKSGDKERKVTVNEEYLRHSIKEPGSDIVEGYPPIMPQVELSDDEINEIINYLKGEAQSKALDGHEVAEKKGCLGCHSIDGTRIVGPTFKGLWGSKREVKTGNKEREVTVDEAYIRHSIMEPAADLVDEYPPIMPQIELTEEELTAIVRYIEGL